jgi:hypothetical protein
MSYWSPRPHLPWRFSFEGGAAATSSGSVRWVGRLPLDVTSSARSPRDVASPQESQTFEVADVRSHRLADQLDQLQVFKCCGLEPARVLAIADPHRDQDPTTLDAHACTSYAVAARES